MKIFELIAIEACNHASESLIDHISALWRFNGCIVNYLTLIAPHKTNEKKTDARNYLMVSDYNSRRNLNSQ